MKYKDTERACDICGSLKSTKIWERKKWCGTILLVDEDKQLHQHIDVMCDECGLVFKNPMLTRESMEEFYDQEYSNLYRSNMIDGISKATINNNVMVSIYTFDWLQSIGYELQDKSVFEVGTGMGLLLKGMDSFGAKVSGIDSDKRSIELAAKLFGFKFENRNFDTDYNSTIKYDLVVCCNTLEHFFSPLEILIKMKSMMKDEGRMLVEVPDLFMPYPATTVDGFLSSAHNYTFCKDTFTRLAHKAGLDVINFGQNGHKTCMFFLLGDEGLDKPNDNPSYIMGRFDKVSKSLKQTATYNKVAQDALKELSEGIYVNTIIDTLKRIAPDIYNPILLVLATKCIETGRSLDGLKLLQHYDHEQPYDLHCCNGSFLYLQAMCYRQLGDFKKMMRLLKECTDYYPNTRKYNFVKDLEIDGILSNTQFSQDLWWNAERVKQAYE